MNRTHNADPFSKAYLPSANQNEAVKEDAWNVSDIRSPTEVEAEHMNMTKFGPANSSSNFVRNKGCWGGNWCGAWVVRNRHQAGLAREFVGCTPLSAWSERNCRFWMVLCWRVKESRYHLVWDNVLLTKHMQVKWVSRAFFGGLT